LRIISIKHKAPQSGGKVESMMYQRTIRELNEMVETLMIENAKLKAGRTKTGPGRKEEVLAILEREPTEIYDIAEELNISNKNVSSQLCYLKKDGYSIATNSKGQKFLEDWTY